MNEALQSFLRVSHQRHVAFLDSVVGGGRSLLGTQPSVVFSCRGRQISIEWMEGRRQDFEADPFEVLEDLLASQKTRNREGAAIGYLGYGLKNLIEKLPARARDDLQLPDCWFGFYDKLAVFNSQTSASKNPPPVSFPHPPASNFSRPDYLAAVARAKDYITAGDLYQVNLSQRFHSQTDATGPQLYRTLRETNPAPFAAYLDVGHAQILSSSPESFLRLEGRRIQTRPIKGTRPRTGDEASDAIAKRELMMSAKDQAELLMITDLLRNDLGRVCEFGTVHVPELVRLEEYATVFHLVSTIEGTLRQEVGPVAAVRACFPGGSITGAPKIRAIQIIDELEPHARGVYTGAIGYFGYDDTSHFNIAIRTMVKRGRDVYFHAGGGLVADSDPAKEYDETLAKARGMIAALQAVESSKHQHAGEVQS